MVTNFTLLLLSVSRKITLFGFDMNGRLLFWLRAVMQNLYSTPQMHEKV